MSSTSPRRSLRSVRLATTVATLAAASVALTGCGDPTDDGSGSSVASNSGSSSTSPTTPRGDGGEGAIPPRSSTVDPARPTPTSRPGSGELAERNANPRVASFAGISAPKPPTWSWQPPNGMRAGTWTIPGQSGGNFATLASFVGIMGGVDANINRWIGQFRPQDGGGPLAPERWTIEVDGIGTVHMVAVEGRFGGMTGNFADGQALLGAVVDPSPVGPVQLKLTGPAEVIENARADFEAFVTGMRLDAEFETPAGGEG